MHTLYELCLSHLNCAFFVILLIDSPSPLSLSLYWKEWPGYTSAKSCSVSKVKKVSSYYFWCSTKGNVIWVWNYMRVSDSSHSFHFWVNYSLKVPEHNTYFVWFFFCLVRNTVEVLICRYKDPFFALQHCFVSFSSRSLFSFRLHLLLFSS